MVRRLPAVVLACLGAFAAAIPRDAPALPDVQLGQALYESRCTACHDRSVHSRDPRSAQTFQQIRAYVFRWDRELGGLWRSDELDAVAHYLNQRYYHFPCPSPSCDLASR